MQHLRLVLLLSLELELYKDFFFPQVIKLGIKTKSN